MTGETGLCTFNWNCNVAHGVHIGHCVDRFFIGTCCKIPEKNGLRYTSKSNGFFKNFSSTTTTTTEPSTEQQSTEMDSSASVFYNLATTIEENQPKPIVVEKNGLTPAENSPTTSNINNASFNINQVHRDESSSSSSIPSNNLASSFHTIFFTHPLQNLHNSTHSSTFNKHAPYPESFPTSPNLQEPTSTYLPALQTETGAQVRDKSQQGDFALVHHEEPIREPVIDNLPASMHETFDMRKPVALNPQHDMRKPVSAHTEHDMRKPVATHAQHDMRKPVLFNEDHDQRWPVLEEDSHDRRTPTENYEWNMDWEYPTNDRNTIPNNINYFTDVPKPVTEFSVTTLPSNVEDKLDYVTATSSNTIPSIELVKDKLDYDASTISNTIPSIELIFSDLNNNVSTNNMPISNDYRKYTLSPLPSTESLNRNVTPATKNFFSLDTNLVCGRPKSSTTGRIVGGRKSHNLGWPWMISLQRYEEFTFRHRCGASLLNQFWAVTAAHCVHRKRAREFTLLFGEHNFYRRDRVHPRIERRVQTIFIHPKYDSYTFENDLALLEFDHAIQYQNNVIPVCLPAYPEDFTGQIAVVTGWGKLAEGGELPDSLHEVYMPVISNKECEKMFLEAGYREDIQDVFLCAGLPHGGRDACDGDSGGPMVIKTGGKWTLVGLISWGISCAAPKQPGVYTRISKFRDWINGIID